MANCYTKTKKSMYIDDVSYRAALKQHKINKRFQRRFFFVNIQKLFKLRLFSK